jgi:cytochrome c oxidase cbb3-type subunit 2
MAVESRQVRLEQGWPVLATGQALIATVVAALFGVLSFVSSTLADGAPPRPLGDADAEAGQTLYVRECSACHGERGDGAGPAAAFLQPRPRDFTKRIFKVRTTDSGMPPRTEDLLRTIERGFPGTAMPSFAFLADEERRRIAARVLTLAGLLHEPEPAMIPLPASPPPLTPQSVTRGKQLYRDAECFSCHGRQGKGDGPTAATLKDVDDRPIPPRDLTSGVFRGGDDRLDLYVRILTGMDGSPMPSFASAIEPVDCWALVDYMLSLRKPRVQKPSRGGRTGAALEIAARTGCRGCHVLGDGKGGAVGPDLRLSAQKLRSEWLEAFLRHPREPGSIYPASTYRMPDMRLADDEVRILVDYIVQLAKRGRLAAPAPDVSSFRPQKVEEGKTVFVSRCAPCHALGGAGAGSGSPRGPDLTAASARLDFEGSKKWLAEHKKIDASTLPLRDDDIDSVRMFVWKTSAESSPSKSAANH